MENANIIIPQWHVAEAMIERHRTGGRIPTALEQFIYDFEPAGRKEASEFRMGLAELIEETCKCKCDSGDEFVRDEVEQFQLMLEKDTEQEPE